MIMADMTISCGSARSLGLADSMYTICTVEEWRDENFDPYYFEMVYGVFFNLKLAKMRAKEINGVVIQLEDDVTCKFPDHY